MRDDLIEARASVDWAIAQIPALQERFISWQRAQPYRFAIEPDPEGKGQLLVAYPKERLDPLINAEGGAIINSVRAALDLLASALAVRNGKDPSPKTHFPIFKHAADFLRRTQHIEKEGWLTKDEIATVESLRPYQGGHEALYPLHQLDVLRKHHRLIVAEAVITETHITHWGSGVEPYWRRLDDKTILYRLPTGTHFRPSQGNTLISSHIFINEPALGLNRQLATPLLRMYVTRVAEIIAMFDTP